MWGGVLRGRGREGGACVEGCLNVRYQNRQTVIGLLVHNYVNYTTKYIMWYVHVK